MVVTPYKQAAAAVWPHSGRRRRSPVRSSLQRAFTPGVNLLPETVEEVSSHPRIASKEASGSVDQATEILPSSPITLLSGEDSLTALLLAVGAKGSLRGRNLWGKRCGKCSMPSRGKNGRSGPIHRRLFGYPRLFLETNPPP